MPRIDRDEVVLMVMAFLVAVILLVPACRDNDHHFIISAPPCGSNPLDVCAGATPTPGPSPTPTPCDRHGHGGD